MGLCAHADVFVGTGGLLLFVNALNLLNFGNLTVTDIVWSVVDGFSGYVSCTWTPV